MKVCKIKILLATIVIFWHVYMGSISAEDSISFKNIKIDDGLSQSTVEEIFQDSKGYIWIGTNDGLNRYNGYDMKIYKADKNDEQTIISNYIMSIDEDEEGNIWIGTDNGISKINSEDDSIINYQYPKSNEYRFYNVHDILITKNGNVMIGSCSGVYLYDKEKDEFNRIFSEKNLLTSNDIVTIEEDKYNNLWIGTENGLNKVDLKTKKIYKYTSKEENAISGDYIIDLLSDDKGYMWVSTSEDGLNKINIETNEVVTYKHEKNNKHSIPSNSTKGMLQDKNGTIWIGTEKGLSKYVKEKDQFITYKNKSYDSTTLSNDIVYSMIEDSNGFIWVGTYIGVSLFDPNNQIKKYKHDPVNKNSLSDNIIHGIYEDSEGLIWAGTKDKGINIIDRDIDKYTHIKEGNTEYDLSSNIIRDIKGKDNTIWIGTRNGLNEVDKSTMKIRKYTVDDGLVSNKIESLFIDSKGYLWIGTVDGINILNTENKEIINITNLLKEHGLEDTYIKSIYETKDGKYLIGTFILGELIKLDPTNKTIKIFNYHGVKDQGNRSEIYSIRSIVEDDSNNLWIGTNYGLVKFDLDKQKVMTYTEKDGLSNNTVYGILLDEQNNPWVSTNNGISKLNVKTNKFRYLSSIDGLQSNEFNLNAYYKSQSGEFLFGGVNGLNSFYPKDISDESNSLVVTFDSFEIGGKSYKNIDNLSFKYNQNTIKIKFFIPEYKNNNIQYEYKLDDSNKEWIKINSNEVVLNDLDPGKYTFKIKASSNNRIVGDESSVTFTIKNPIWKTNEAIIVYVLIFFTLVYRNMTKVKRLDYLVEKRTRELSEEMKKNNILFNKAIENERNKNNYFINLSHELRTPLNIINSIEQLITNFNKSENGITKEKLDYYMEISRKNIFRLLNLINNIIDTTKIENGKYKLNIDSYDIVYIVEETALNLKRDIEDKGINLIIDTDVEEKIIRCDKQEIERCIINLLSNSLKFTNEGGTIDIYIKDLDENVLITIEDTGIGIEEKYCESIFDRFNQIIDDQTELKGGSGLGLTITKHIIDLHSGEIFVESELNKGSKFTIILPVSNISVQA